MTMVAIGDVADIVMGQAPPGAACNKTGDGVPFVKAGEFSDRRPIIREWTTKPLKLAKHGDVLVCVVGATAGKVNQGADCAIGRSVAAVRPRRGLVDSDYLYRFLSGQVDRLRAASQGLAQGVIARDMITSLRLLLPSLEEQRRVAAILDRADVHRAKRRNIMTQLDSLDQSIFVEMFGDPVRNPRRLPSQKLTALGELDRGVSKHRPRNDPALLGGPYPLIQTGDVANSGGYITQYTATYSDLGLAQSRIWPAGTLCITIAANIARTGVLAFDACFPDSVVGFTSERETATFVRVWLSFLQATLEASAPQSAQKNINLAVLRALEVPTPSKFDIQEFAARVDQVNAQRAAVKRALTADEELFAALQFRAFRGELG